MLWEFPTARTKAIRRVLHRHSADYIFISWRHYQVLPPTKGWQQPILCWMSCYPFRKAMGSSRVWKLWTELKATCLSRPLLQSPRRLGVQARQFSRVKHKKGQPQRGLCPAVIFSDEIKPWNTTTKFYLHFSADLRGYQNALIIHNIESFSGKHQIG